MSLSSQQPAEAAYVYDSFVKIKHAQHTCLQIADQKVALSIQSYDLIDNHVRRLDHDLQRLENELKQEGRLLHRCIVCQAINNILCHLAATSGDAPLTGNRNTRKSKEEQV